MTSAALDFAKLAMTALGEKLLDAVRRGRVEDVVLAIHMHGANVSDPMQGTGALLLAVEKGHTDVIDVLIDEGADVHPQALSIAFERGDPKLVSKLLAACVDLNQADNDGETPLYKACQEGHTEIASTLLDSGAKADLGKQVVDWNYWDERCSPMYAACLHGHLDCAKLLSSHGARRTLPFPAPGDTAENVADLATHNGHHELAAWLRATGNWTPLHHLEVLTPERTFALLRGGGNIHAAAGDGGETPLSRAQAMAAAGRAAEGTAAFLVLEAAKPWSRKTHKYFPEPARARAVELWPWGFRFSRRFPREEQAMYDVWMNFVMPHEVTRDYHPRGDVDDAADEDDDDDDDDAPVNRRYI